MSWEVICITNVILCVSVGGTFPGTLKNSFGYVMVWSVALAGESPCVLLLHFWLINVPGEVGLVVRKPTTIARVPSIHDAFFQSINYDWCPCFSRGAGNGPWGQGRDTVGWETVFGEWICLKMLNSYKQHSSYMVWLATKTSMLFVDPRVLEC